MRSSLLLALATRAAGFHGFHPAPRRALTAALRSAGVPGDVGAATGVAQGKHMRAARGEGRRTHRNKYADKRSKEEPAAAAADPWERLVARGAEVEAANAARRKPARVASEDPTRVRSLARATREWDDVAALDPNEPRSLGFLEIGVVVSSHGVDGAVKVKSESDFASARLCTPGTRHLKSPLRAFPRPVALLSGKRQAPGTYIVTLEGVRDVDAAAALKGYTLFARAVEDAQQAEELLGDGEFLIDDLVGLAAVWNATDADAGGRAGHPVGVVAGVVSREEYATKAAVAHGHDLLELALGVAPGDGDEALEEAPRALVPFVPQLVPVVDVAAGLVRVQPPAGLLDLAVTPAKRVRLKGLLAPAGNRES